MPTRSQRKAKKMRRKAHAQRQDNRTNMPTPSVWADMCEIARRQRKGLAKVVQAHGFALIHEHADPKDRMSWRAAVTGNGG